MVSFYPPNKKEAKCQKCLFHWAAAGFVQLINIFIHSFCEPFLLSYWSTAFEMAFNSKTRWRKTTQSAVCLENKGPQPFILYCSTMLSTASVDTFRLVDTEYIPFCSLLCPRSAWFYLSHSQPAKFHWTAFPALLYVGKSVHVCTPYISCNVFLRRICVGIR